MAVVCIDSDYLDINGDGELTLVPGRSGLRSREIYFTAGADTFEKADFPGLQRVWVQVQGAGGGSAGADAAPGQIIARVGGAGGGFSESIISASSLGASVPIVVGAGGAAGNATTAGNAGGQSSFGGSVIANGGDGGTVAMTTGVGPSTVTGIPGANTTGAAGALQSGGGASGGAFRIDASAGMSGAGGDSRLGFGGFQRGSEGDGGLPRGRGSGGGGSMSEGGLVNGQAGADGLVIVWLIY